MGNPDAKSPDAKSSLTGANKYTVTFSTKDAEGDEEEDDASAATSTDVNVKTTPLPPVTNFWSLTMYDAQTGLLVDNAIDRYVINSGMLKGGQDDGQSPALVTADDGTLTLYIQHDEPEARNACFFVVYAHSQTAST